MQIGEECQSAFFSSFLFGKQAVWYTFGTGEERNCEDMEGRRMPL